MGKVRIVTDSAAQFLDPSVVERYGIVVLPHTVGFNGRGFQESVDLDSIAFFRRLANGALPTLSPPSVEQFKQAYLTLARETNSVLSIHVSQTINGACASARSAAQLLLGRCNIHILDSMLASVGLGFLVETAARLAENGETLDSLARTIRRQTSRVFMLFYAESLDSLQRAGVLNESHAMLGDMLGLRVLVTIEDGQLVAIEKARTRAHALDKLVEFVAEFNPADKLVIVQPPTQHEALHSLQARLTEELHWPPCPVMAYTPSLAVLLGPDALGVIIHQRIGLSQERQ